MKNQTSLLRVAGFMTLALAVMVCAGFEAWAAAAKAATEKRADVVTIDAMAKDGNLELPAVTFLHDQHTKALEAAGKDCSSCHRPLREGEKAYSFAFMGSDQARGDALKTLYHTNCIGCHTEMKGAAKTGPQEGECRSCHAGAPAVSSDRQDIGLDKVMHYKHIASSHIKYEGSDKNCGVCHTEYDPEKKETVWAKGKEDSWRASYLTVDAKAAALKANPDALDASGRRIADQPTLEQYAHQTCVNCHIAVAAIPQATSGPISCAGCHSPAAQAAFAAESAKIADTIPRLERGQDDSVLMMPPADKEREYKGMMRPVSFNHKVHESAVMDCRSCHHKKIDSCSTCHSLEGKKEGNFVPLSQAMHSSSAKQSCVGCHNIQKQQPSCAGCHVTAPVRLSQDSCSSCHSTPVGIDAAEAESGSLLALDKDSQKALSQATVAERASKGVSTYSREDIPETVTIGILSKDYEPSKFPHRKIVETLLDRQKNNRMAAAFHTDVATLCQGCHHNSPPSKTPPKCVSCHGVDMAPSVGSLLPLKAAYHQQCITCHERMNQKPLATECADCHKPRGN